MYDVPVLDEGKPFRVMVVGDVGVDNYETLSKSLDVLLADLKDDCIVYYDKYTSISENAGFWARAQNLQTVMFNQDEALEILEDCDILIAFWDELSNGYIDKLVSKADRLDMVNIVINYKR